MTISSVFIRRPRLAFVVSTVISIAGLIAMTVLPVAQFPDIVPPQVRVTAVYPGASAQAVEESVAQVIEAQVNGVERMLYMKSTSGGDGSYSLTGHKWFTSAPMCDVFLVLAQAPGGLSCFFLPRILPDGSRNRMFLQRLKEKLGNHANASSEVEYDGAIAWLVGEEGRGVPTIIEMVNLTRLDCTLGSATSMRTGLTRAIHHAQHGITGLARTRTTPAGDRRRKWGRCR